MKRWVHAVRSNERLSLFLKAVGLFLLLFLAIASAALYNIIATESNPFFYARF